MDEKAEIANTEPARLPYLVWGGVRVVTTEVLAKLYETAATNIKSNFNNNKPRFVEGKHFYRLNGQALRDFKSNKVVQADLVTNKHTKELLLWTQQGAARHAKMLETDKAWEVFEELEDSYFKERQASGSSLWDARLEVERYNTETFAAASQGSHAMHARKAAIPIIRAKRQQLKLLMEPELPLLPTTH